MPERPELPSALRVATRALEGEFEGGQEIAWDPELRVWSFEVLLFVESESSEWIPDMSRWWVIVGHQYPAGRLDVMPAKEEGVEATFPHQNRNSEGPPDRPWRSGKLCLDSSISRLKSFGLEVEPRDAAHRLLWNLRRARSWLSCAARGELFLRGDPFELPDYRTDASGELAIFEMPSRFAAWCTVKARAGLVTLRQLGSRRLAIDFFDSRGEQVVPEVNLGSFVADASGTDETGIWIRFDRVPSRGPWQAPMTWRELEASAKDQGFSIMDEVAPLVDLIGRPRDTREERLRPHLLIGFPIPKQFEEEPVQMHWVAFRMPRLARANDAPDGFRSHSGGRRRWDESKLRKLASLPWMSTENWSDESLTGRGHLSISDLKATVIGCGAVGGVVAEWLVRGGLRSVNVVDGDSLEAGNLVRHTLTLEDVGRNKAEALADFLQRLSPHVEAMAVPRKFDAETAEKHPAVLETDLIFDCTADDELLLALEEVRAPSSALFVSMATGPCARRLYMFLCRGEAFDRGGYVEAITPWIEQDWDGVDPADFPRDGLGCWHPLMPGTYLDLCCVISTALKVLVERLDSKESRMIVIGPREKDGQPMAPSAILLDEQVG